MKSHRHRSQRPDRHAARRAPARPRRRGHHAVAQPVLPGRRRVAARGRAGARRGARRPRRGRPPRRRERRAALVRRRQAPHPQLARARHAQPRGRDRGRRAAPARARLLLGGRLLRPARRRAHRRADAAPATTSSPRSASSGSARRARAADLGLRVVTMRTGVVLDQGGGALAKMLPFFKLGVGGPVAGGDQYMPWIHVDDVVGLYLAALDGDDWQGPVNASAPEPVTNKDVLQGARPRAPPPRLRARPGPRGPHPLRRDGRDRHQGPARDPAARAGARLRLRAPGPRRGPAQRAASEPLLADRGVRAAGGGVAGHLGLARLLAALPGLALVPLRGRVLGRDREPDQRRRGR